MNIDLILKDVLDPVIRENFFRLQKSLMTQQILLPDFSFYEVDIPDPSILYPIPHGLKYAPTDAILLSCTGDYSFYFRYDLFDSKNVYVAAKGPVRIRFLLCRFPQQGRRTLQESGLLFLAPGAHDSPSSVGSASSGSDGWAFIQDSQYTVSSPFSVLANARTKIPNNGAGTLTNYVNAPAQAASWWDPVNATFWPSANGEFYTFRLNLALVPTLNNMSVKLDYDIGTANKPWTQTIFLNNGAGVETRQALAIPAPIGPSAFSNGIAFYITSECDLDVNSINLTVIRDFKK